MGTHLRGYLHEHFHPLIDNRIETTPDEALIAQYRQAKSDVLDQELQFKSYMDAQWPPGANERNKTQTSYEEKREDGALGLITALKTVEDILKTLLNPISDFDFKFNLPKKPIEEAT